jgi:hypothetical protein
MTPPQVQGLSNVTRHLVCASRGSGTSACWASSSADLTHSDIRCWAPGNRVIVTPGCRPAGGLRPDAPRGGLGALCQAPSGIPGQPLAGDSRHADRERPKKCWTPVAQGAHSPMAILCGACRSPLVSYCFSAGHQRKATSPVMSAQEVYR